MSGTVGWGLSARAWLAVCLGVIFLMSVVPFVNVLRSGAGFDTVANPAQLHEYYTPLMQAVAEGHSRAGNPWLFEHRDDMNSRQVFPYWVSALPLFAGLPLPVAAAVNFSLWSVTFGLLLYLILLRFGLSGAWSALGTIYGYVEMYTYLLRPVAMQLAFPSFLFLILATLLWYEQPRDRYRVALIALATAGTVYTYGFLYQISAVFLGLLFLYLLYRRDWTRIVSALAVGALTVVLCIPFITSTLAQVSDPHYVEAMVRTGMVFTHSLNVLAVYQMLWVLALIGVMYFLWSSAFRVREYLPFATVEQFSIMGLALVAVSLSGVISGIDLQTANHVDRFYRLWLIIGTMVVVYTLFVQRSAIMQFSVAKKMLTAFSILLLVYLNIAVAPLTPLTLRNLMSDGRADVKADMEMYPALQWLDSQSDEPLVVWVDPLNYKLDNNVIIYTKHYQLSGESPTSQLVSDEELQERYLVASAASEVTKESIASGMWTWGLNGFTRDTPEARNREVHQCELLRLDLFGHECGQRTDASKLYGHLHESMYAKYVREIQPRLDEMLKKYHVAFVIKDTLTDTEFHPERLESLEEVYSDGRFLVYKVN